LKTYQITMQKNDYNLILYTYKNLRKKIDNVPALIHTT
jgi:hypothetical protein